MEISVNYLWGILILCLIIAFARYFIQKKRKGARQQLSSTDGATPVLNRFSRDLTQAARENKIDPLIGREKELSRVIQILSRRTKNNVILVGEAGTGKTRIAEGLALTIIKKQVTEPLQRKRVLALNLGGMLAGTQYRGEFEQRIQAITREISQAGREIILFIDEIQNLTQAGESSGAISAANLLKPALARGEIQAIGATTINDYYQFISKDVSLERRFQPIMVKEPTPDETLLILKGVVSEYEKFHKVKIPEETLKAAIELSAKYLSDRYFPDKAIDLIDEAAAKVRLETITKGEESTTQILVVTQKDIEDVIFQWSSDVTALKQQAKAGGINI